LFQTSLYFFHLVSKYSYQLPVLKHLETVIPLMYDLYLQEAADKTK
jgi:hypothetical protein